MTEKDRRREQRHSCSRPVGLFLSRGPDGPAVSPVFEGQLLSLSRWGAGIALSEVMAGSTHLAYGPMESSTLQLNVVFSLPDGEEQLTVPVRPIWLDKIQTEDMPPFRIGVEFVVPLAKELLLRLNRQTS